MPWNPDQYLKFQTERFAPFEDLLKLIECRENLNVIDLGCGTGELTRRLADTLPGSSVVGIDSSAEMLARAQSQARPGLHFEQALIEDVQGQYDLLFSHAAIQWVGDHDTLIPRLFSLLRPGGQIAVQIPSNHGHYAHLAMIETICEEPFKSAVGGWSRQSPVLPVGDYASLLFASGGQDLVVFEKVYPHVLENADAILEWVSGTALVPYMEHLPESLRELFKASYREKLRQHWPSTPVFYGFQRILFSARKP
ncbi:MAG TPA: methyltransferase domain-containing protein [Aggregatilineales bacterium]|nr:methyltransferase domain-containing protein [Aggregatilineales bacterium]